MNNITQYKAEITIYNLAVRYLYNFIEIYGEEFSIQKILQLKLIFINNAHKMLFN